MHESSFRRVRFPERLFATSQYAGVRMATVMNVVRSEEQA
jgi:hypothetical protein